MEGIAYHLIEDNDKPKMSLEMDDPLIMSQQAVRHRRHLHLSPLTSVSLVVFLFLYSSLLVLGTMRIVRKNRPHESGLPNCKSSASLIAKER